MEQKVQPTVKALLVDLDGTLVDSLGDFVAALGAVAQEQGWESPAADTVRHWIGRGGDRLIEDWLNHLDQPAALHSAVKARYEHHYRAINGRFAHLRPGTVTALQALRGAGLGLACVTNKPSANARALLVQMGLADCFSVVVGGGPDVRPKPAPDSLLQAAAQLGCTPAETWMVGDSANDAAAARAAGCAAVVLLRGGYNHGRPIDEEPALAHVDGLEALLPLIAGGR